MTQSVNPRPRDGRLTDDGRGPVVGVVGGGQLGRMLGLAGIPLGLRFRFLEPAAEPPAAALGSVIRAPYDDPGALDELASGAAVVTYEFENVPVEAARRIAARTPVHPAPAALEMAQDRLVEKESFRRLGIETAPFHPVGSASELESALDVLGVPAILKTRRMGYDGKGQVMIERAADAPSAWEALGTRHDLLLEGFVDFARELSILAVRGRDGETRFYPLVENEHRDGILVRSRVPARGVGPALQAKAEGIAGRILDDLGYVGVLAVELFHLDDGMGEGGLIANEMAPRVHNSGHWTQDGAWTSQFENHLRAVVGLPLGSTGIRGDGAVMLNLLGAPPPRDELLRIPGTRVHLYDKAPRPGRKVGHLNLVGGDRGGEGLDERTQRAEAVLQAATQSSQSP